MKEKCGRDKRKCDFGLSFQLSKFVAAEREKATVYPPANEVFTWTNTCPINQVRIFFAICNLKSISVIQVSHMLGG